MAPSATATVTETAVPKEQPALDTLYKEFQTYYFSKDAETGKVAGIEAAKYPHYLPTWDKTQSFPPLEPFEHYEHGKDADTSFPELLPSEAKVNHLTPTIGTEVHGVQLSGLSAAGKDQLARFVAERKVVAFRNQDFKDLSIPDALKFGEYFGRHHIHPTSGAPEGFPEIHLVHRGAGDTKSDEYFADRISSVAWHSDVSYELQPPGTTFLYILDTPEVGGDTLFANCVEAYNRLSPLFKERLHGLQAVHSGIEQVAVAHSRGSPNRRNPVRSVHPIVRTHPATGEKALYVNPQFTRSIVGLKKEESDAILKFLYDHIGFGADFHSRVKWEEGTVVVWDNRVTQHSALLDFSGGQRRHLARITPQAEAPYETPFKN
ncbi:hypothetical protein F4808DRAFT_451056 [Astrocystis sublimbata]|nr:hypothetical protein F4808DRAFT_451056 [Astrocystis sublimbata]